MIEQKNFYGGKKTVMTKLESQPIRSNHAHCYEKDLIYLKISEKRDLLLVDRNLPNYYFHWWNYMFIGYVKPVDIEIFDM